MSSEFWQGAGVIVCYLAAFLLIGAAIQSYAEGRYNAMSAKDKVDSLVYLYVFGVLGLLALFGGLYLNGVLG